MSTPFAPPDPGDVHVWQVRLDVDGDELQALHAVLSADERERAQRFVRPLDASCTVAARAHLRLLLARYLGCAAAGVALGAGPQGKPHITAPDAGWLRFNLSHSGDLALIAVANGHEVGVDIERIQPELADPGLAASFTRAEQQTLERLAEGQYVRQCFRLWTRKEAVVKGLGLGLMVPLDRVDVLEDRVQIAPTQILPRAAPSGWTVQSLGLGDEYCAAVAVEERAQLLATAATDHLTDRHQDDLYVEPERPVLDVVVVESCPVGNRRVASKATDLGEPGQPARHAVPMLVARVLRREPVDEERTLGARAHQAHVTTQDVEQLR